MSAAPLMTGSLSKLLWPGVNKVWEQLYAQYEDQYTKIFEKHTSDQNWEEDVLFTGLGLLTVKAEGAPVEYDSMKLGWITRYVPTVMAGGFQITREAVDDLKYKTQINAKAKALVKSDRHTRETIGANVLNRAFTAGFTGGDGSILCVNNHPNVNGGTYSNVLATPAQLSEAALEDMNIQIWQFTDDRGLKAALKPRKLIIPQALTFEAERILNTQGRYNTANNDLNAMKTLSSIPDGYVANPWLTSATAYWLKTDVSDGFKYFERNAPEFKADNAFDEEIAKFKVRSRYVFGWTDPKVVVGTPGV